MYKAYPMLRAENIIKEKTGISVFYNRYTSQNYGELHWHNYYTIDIALSGEGVHYLNGCEYPIRKGDITLVKPTDIHYIYSKTEMNMAAIRFVDSAMDNEYKHLLQYPTVTHGLKDDELDLLTMYCRSIDRCNNILKVNHDALYLDELFLNFRLVLILLARQKNTLPTISNNRIAQIVQYINMHFRERITQEKIAQIAELSPAYFSVWFKKNVGMSFVEYINRCRLDYACSMLKKGGSVIESCFESGFNSISHFNSTFKSMVGMTPREYKNIRDNTCHNATENI